MGWEIPRWLASELAFVLEQWHIPPDVWLRQNVLIRAGIWRHLSLTEEADTSAYVPPSAQLVDDTRPTAPPPGLLGMFTPRAEPIVQSEQ